MSDLIQLKPCEELIVNDHGYVRPSGDFEVDSQNTIIINAPEGFKILIRPMNDRGEKTYLQLASGVESDRTSTVAWTSSTTPASNFAQTSNDNFHTLGVVVVVLLGMLSVAVGVGLIIAAWTEWDHQKRSTKRYKDLATKNLWLISEYVTDLDYSKPIDACQIATQKLKLENMVKRLEEAQKSKSLKMKHWHYEALSDDTSKFMKDYNLEIKEEFGMKRLIESAPIRMTPGVNRDDYFIYRLV